MSVKLRVIEGEPDGTRRFENRVSAMLNAGTQRAREREWERRERTKREAGRREAVMPDGTVRTVYAKAKDIAGPRDRQRALARPQMALGLEVKP